MRLQGTLKITDNKFGGTSLSGGEWPLPSVMVLIPAVCPSYPIQAPA